MITKTNPFQNPRNDPVSPTAMRSGKLTKSGLMNDAMRFVDGATHIERRTTNIINGMRIYCLKDSDGRLDDLPVPARSETGWAFKMVS